MWLWVYYNTIPPIPLIRIWPWVYYNKIPLYPLVYLLKGDHNRSYPSETLLVKATPTSSEPKLRKKPQTVLRVNEALQSFQPKEDTESLAAKKVLVAQAMRTVPSSVPLHRCPKQDVQTMCKIRILTLLCLLGVSRG